MLKLILPMIVMLSTLLLLYGRPVEGRSVIVIGGGVSGVTTAARIANASEKYEVLLLEASNRIGGRVRSINFVLNPIELGAGWIHGEVGNNVFKLVKPFGVIQNEPEDDPYYSQTFVTQHGEFLPDYVTIGIQKAMNILIVKKDIPRYRYASLGEYVTTKFWKCNAKNPIICNKDILAGILDWMERYQNMEDGSDSWFRTSYRGQLEYKYAEGNPTVTWKSPYSYSTLFQIIINGSVNADQCEQPTLPNWIKLNKEVISIKYDVHKSKNAVTVKCKDGMIYVADHIVCTVSLGFLQAKSNRLFSPRLSAHRIKAIHNIGFDTMDRIFMEFHTIWWDKYFTAYNLVWDDTVKVKLNWKLRCRKCLLKEIDGIPVFCRGLLGFHPVRNNPRVMYTFITGKLAHFMERLTPQVLKNALFKVIKKFFGRKFNVTAPIRIARGKWHTNPLVRGSYSFRTVSSEIHNVYAKDLAEPILNNFGIPIVSFAGEHTHPNFYSTVHGAFDSGNREAERLLALS